jgi:16S rRNA pseudouridine516 synthase
MSAAACKLRVDRLLSRYGYCSRREAPSWLRAGRVTLDGMPLRDPAEHVLPSAVHIDAAPIEAPDGLLAMLHKPAGFVCSRDSSDGPTVFDLLPARWSQRHPPVTSVGRLDRETTGLLLITDAGEWVQRWTSPRRHVEKTYDVTVDGELFPDLEKIFASGTLLLDGEATPCLPARLECLSNHTARVHLVEGRFRQVRRMFAAAGLRVIRLHRPRFGGFELGDLPEGCWRWLAFPKAESSPSHCGD